MPPKKQPTQNNKISIPELTSDKDEHAPQMSQQQLQQQFLEQQQRYFQQQYQQQLIQWERNFSGLLPVANGLNPFFYPQLQMHPGFFYQNQMLPGFFPPQMSVNIQNNFAYPQPKPIPPQLPIQAPNMNAPEIPHLTWLGKRTKMPSLKKKNPVPRPHTAEKETKTIDMLPKAAKLDPSKYTTIIIPDETPEPVRNIRRTNKQGYIEIPNPNAMDMAAVPRSFTERLNQFKVTDLHREMEFSATPAPTIPQRQMFPSPIATLKNPVSHLLKREELPDAETQAAKRQKIEKEIAADILVSLGTPPTPPIDNLPQNSKTPPFNRNDHLVPERKASNPPIADIEELRRSKTPEMEHMRKNPAQKRGLRRQERF